MRLIGTRPATVRMGRPEIQRRRCCSMGLRLTMIKIPSRAFVRRQSASIEESLVRARLERLAGRRVTREGVLVINARRHRTQERNREDARECLFDLHSLTEVLPP